MRFHRISTNMHLALFSLGVTAIWLAPDEVSARSDLKAEQTKVCQSAASERNKLDSRELRDLLGKKPQEEAANLDSEKLDNLRRLIELDAQVMFKCRLMAHPDLKRRSPNKVRSRKQLLSVATPDLPMRKPKVEKTAPKQANLLPLPVRKPK